MTNQIQIMFLIHFIVSNPHSQRGPPLFGHGPAVTALTHRSPLYFRNIPGCAQLGSRLALNHLLRGDFGKRSALSPPPPSLGPPTMRWNDCLTVPGSRSPTLSATDVPALIAREDADPTAPWRRAHPGEPVGIFH